MKYEILDHVAVFGWALAYVAVIGHAINALVA